VSGNRRIVAERGSERTGIDGFSSSQAAFETAPIVEKVTANRRDDVVGSTAKKQRGHPGRGQPHQPLGEEEQKADHADLLDSTAQECEGFDLPGLGHHVDCLNRDQSESAVDQRRQIADERGRVAREVGHASRR